MRGIRVMRRGMGWRVRGMKGGSSGSMAESRGRVEVERDRCVVGNVGCGAGAVEGRNDGEGSGGERDVVRREKSG